jgi:hypothetical protein
MSEIRTKRRRVRQAPPDILRAINEELLTGASAPEVVKALYRLADDGKLPHDGIPSERTVSNMARDLRTSDRSGVWRVTDASPADATTVLEVLAEVVRRTEGRITSLTQAEGALIPTIRRVMAARWTKLPEPGRRWQSYVWTRFYLAWVETDRDAADVALTFAFLQVDGEIPASTWFRIERVNTAVSGWLPEELRAVRDER